MDQLQQWVNKVFRTLDQGGMAFCPRRVDPSTFRLLFSRNWSGCHNSTVDLHIHSKPLLAAQILQNNVNICEVRARILALQFFTEGMKLQIEDFSSLVMLANTSQLIEAQWISSEFGNILS